MDTKIVDVKSRIRREFFNDIAQKKLNYNQTVHYLKNIHQDNPSDFRLVMFSILGDVYAYFKWLMKFDMIDEEEDIEQEKIYQEESELTEMSNIAQKDIEEEDRLFDALEEASSYEDLENIIFDEEFIKTILSFVRELNEEPISLHISIKNNMCLEKEINSIIINGDSLYKCGNDYYQENGLIFSSNYIAEEYISLYNKLANGFCIESSPDFLFMEIIDEIYYYNRKNYYAILGDMREKFFINYIHVQKEDNTADNFVYKSILNLIIDYPLEEIIKFLHKEEISGLFLAELIDNYVNYNSCPYTEEQIRSNEQIQYVKRKLKQEQK